MIINFATDDLKRAIRALSGDTGQILEQAFGEVDYNPTAKTITFNSIDGTQVGTIDTSDFVVDGMVENVSLSGTILTITFNTESGKQNITVDFKELFDADLYYTKTQTDNAIGTAISGFSGTVETKLSQKQDVIADLEVIRNGAASGATAVQPAALNNYYNKQEINTLVEDFVTSGDVASAITEAISGIDLSEIENRIEDVEFTTSQALNELHDDTLNFVTSGDVQTQIEEAISEIDLSNFVNITDFAELVAKVQTLETVTAAALNELNGTNK